MKHLMVVLTSLTISTPVKNDVFTFKDQAKYVINLTKSNGFEPSERITAAIVNASETYSISALELTAIAIIESGVGKYSKVRINKNGTHDVGLFQINTVNREFCIEYNLYSPEGSSLCAAKLLSRHKTKRSDYLGVYHSKTPSFKRLYMQKISHILAQANGTR